jgi:hypothetical protein
LKLENILLDEEKKKNSLKIDTTYQNGKKSPTKKSPLSSPRKYNSIEEVEGKIYELSKDQWGCRFLQKKIEENQNDDLEKIFSEVFEHMVELMTDPFGNYLCQKLVEFCTEKQKTVIIKKVAESLVNIATNMHGTRAVQKLIECLANDEQIQIVIDSLKDSVVTLIKDLNGNHVVQRCLQKMKQDNNNQFIYDSIIGKCVQVATHKHGCCVIQRSLDHASKKQLTELVNEITSNSLVLVQNAFGNYVVQYVLDLGLENVTDDIIVKFFGNIDSLSMNKFSSNVVEQVNLIHKNSV